MKLKFVVFFKVKLRFNILGLCFSKVSNVNEVLGVSKETLMGRILNEWGIEPEFKFVS